MDDAILRDDAVAWRGRVGRCALLVDGEEYYPALRRALLNARSRVLIVGWEFNSRVALVRGEEADALDDGWPVRIGELLERLVREREELEVYLLVWRPAPLFAFERQIVPPLARPWNRHPRLHFRLDAEHPPFASQHQKIVAIDDAIAFIGGMDVTKARWDTHEHVAFDERRRMPRPGHRIHGPYHDVQALVDADAARALSAIARDRWERAARRRLDALPDASHDPWPDGVEPAITDATAGIALTVPESGDDDGVRQVEATLLASIRAARDCVFIENQYLTSRAITDALAERLRDADGPEVVLVLPHGCPSPAQAAAMDTQRDRMLERLREADRHARLGVYWATVPGEADESVFDVSVYIHAKVMTIDDRVLRIGSANLNNRSMGLDTECDLIIESEGRREVEEAIAGFRARVLAYLLGEPVERVRGAIAERSSVLGAVESIRGGERTLRPLTHTADGVAETLALPPELADPDGPLKADDVARVLTHALEQGDVDERVRIDQREATRPTPWWWLAAAALAIGVAGAALAPATSWLGEAWPSSPINLAGAGWPAALLGVAGFAVLGVIVPVTLLIVAAPVLYGPIAGGAISLAGIVGAGAIGHTAGRLLGRRRLARIGGVHVATLARRVTGLGIVSTAIMRNLPIAPFSLLNVACGAMGVQLHRLLIGSVIGMLPGVALASGLGHLVRRFLADPSLAPGAALGAGVLVAVAAAVLAQRWARDRAARSAGGDDA